MKPQCIEMTAILVAEWVREERMTWQRRLEGRAAMLELPLGHESRPFNGMVEYRGYPTGWRPLL